MPRLSIGPKMALHGGLKLARLREMREEDFARMSAKLEAEPLFKRLVAAGAVSLKPFPKAFFATRRFAGMRLSAPPEGAAELLDGDSELARLMRRIGRERFEECFLKGERSSDAHRARSCGISEEQARTLSAFLDRMYVRAEFEDPPPPAPARLYSTVAGIAVQEGRPELRFFTREVWKGRYSLDETRLAAHLASLQPADRERVRRAVKRLELLDRRKTTLYKTLEALLRAQAEYLKTGDASRLQPVTQRSLAAAVGVGPSVINRLIGNKAVELPWGLEAPIKALLPSAKRLALDRLAALAETRPQLSDERLRRELADRWQIHLSRRSVAQYRKDLGLGGRGRR
ncbi:MAG: hypothetical protein ABII00_09850 [Elusimicrobiota bacterium]